MYKNNSMSKTAYVIENTFLLVWLAFIFKSLLFKCIVSFTYTQSKVIFWITIISIFVINTLFTWNKGRNFLNMCCNAILSFGVYTFMSYVSVYPILWGILVMCIILSIAYSLLIMTQRVKRKHNFKSIMSNRLIHCALGWRVVFSVYFLLMIIALCLMLFFGDSLMFSNVKAEIPGNSREWTMENNIDSLNKVEERTWSTLSAKKKINTLQTIANIEATHLGLSHELNVTLGALDESTIACYSDEKHVIVINATYFDNYSAPEILDSLFHEAYHAYQHELCEAYDSVDPSHQNLLIFRNIQDYKKEFSDYISGDDDFISYYRQKCETKAREYGTETVEYYYQYIEKQTTK